MTSKIHLKGICAMFTDKCLYGIVLFFSFDKCFDFTNTMPFFMTFNIQYFKFKTKTYNSQF